MRHQECSLFYENSLGFNVKSYESLFVESTNTVARPVVARYIDHPKEYKRRNG